MPLSPRWCHRQWAHLLSELCSWRIKEQVIQLTTRLSTFSNRQSKSNLKIAGRRSCPKSFRGRWTTEWRSWTSKCRPRRSGKRSQLRKTWKSTWIATASSSKCPHCTFKTPSFSSRILDTASKYWTWCIPSTERVMSCHTDCRSTVVNQFLKIWTRTWRKESFCGWSKPKERRFKFWLISSSREYIFASLNLALMVTLWRCITRTCSSLRYVKLMILMTFCLKFRKVSSSKNSTVLWTTSWNL